MRELLFRGKSVENGEWVYGGVFPNMRRDKWHIGDTWEAVEVEPDTVGQYVGLNDAENKKIFDGDILLFGKKKLVVWFNGEAFQWQAKQIYGDIVTDNIDMGWIAAEVPLNEKMTTKVIGNIHENIDFLAVNNG